METKVTHSWRLYNTKPVAFYVTLEGKIPRTPIWSMIDNSRLEAYGDAKNFVHDIHVDDIVFFSHEWCGLIAAAKVKGEIKVLDSETLYRDVEFLTPTPNRKDNRMLAMPFSQVKLKTGKTFFWARTIKIPYLSKSEALELVEVLNNYLYQT